MKKLAFFFLSTSLLSTQQSFSCETRAIISDTSYEYCLLNGQEKLMISLLDCEAYCGHDSNFLELMTLITKGSDQLGTIPTSSCSGPPTVISGTSSNRLTLRNLPLPNCTNESLDHEIEAIFNSDDNPSFDVFLSKSSQLCGIQLINDDQMLNRIGSMKCLGRISNLGNYSNEVIKFLNDLNLPKLSCFKILTTTHKIPFLLSNFIALSFTKNFRSFLVKSYFMNKFTLNFKNVLSHRDNPDEDLRHITGFAFNRLFSPLNKMGASLASDVDFNFIVDDDYFKEDTDLIVALLREALKQAKQEIEEEFNIDVEVEDFSVKRYHQYVLEKLKNKETDTDQHEVNFLATIIGNEVHIFASESFKNKVIQSIKSNIDAQEKRKRVWENYLGKEAPKGSPMVEFPPNDTFLKEALSPTKKKLLKRYKAHSLIGTDNFSSPEVWSYDTKAFGVRIYDFDPTLSSTQAWNELSLNLQYMKYKLTNSKTDYEIITQQDFIQLMKLYPDFMKELITKACSTVLSEISNEVVYCKHDLSELPQTDSHLLTSGYNFFMNLFSASKKMAYDLRPQ